MRKYVIILALFVFIVIIFSACYVAGRAVEVDTPHSHLSADTITIKLNNNN